MQDTDIDHEAGTVLDVRDSHYFQQLHPSAVPAELSHYGVTAFELMSCVASCGCCVEVGKWSETEVKIDGKEYSIMKESDIMGISGK